MLLSIEEEASSQWLGKEVEKLEASLERNEERRSQQEGGQAYSSDGSPLERLMEFRESLECMDLSRDVSLWQEEYGQDDSPTLVDDARKCIGLGEILCRHDTDASEATSGLHSLLQALWTKEYLPLHKHVRAQLLLQLRRYLRNAGYPSKEACSKIAAECKSFQVDSQNIASYSHWLVQLQAQHEKTSFHFSREAGAAPRDKLDVVVELCRPLVERVAFHFLEEADDRVTSTRIDRLPEWLLGYIHEHFFEGGPWDLVFDSLAVIVADADRLVSEFLNQVSELAFVVLKQRNFFRHEKIAGVNSNPVLLSGAIQQVLSFDAHIREMLPSGSTCAPVSLSQRLIADDEELWEWWLHRERETALATLFDSPVSVGSTQGISPRAELFCALIYSIRSKAALFASSTPYIAHVAVPLCQHFLDAIHESATDLRNLLSQRNLISPENLEKNLLEWIDLINGTHLAALRLVNGDTRSHGGLILSLSSVDHDLARVGRSMERLRDVLVDECATTLVETVLSERAKLASYLMRCSHLLMSHDYHECTGISPDLQDTAAIYSKVMDVCKQVLLGGGDDDNDEMNGIVSFAPTAIKTEVTNRLADKFLEVCLDAHGMTPEIVVEGSRVFYQDAKGVFGKSSDLPPFARRLVDVVRLMTMPPKELRDLRLALFGLAQMSPSDQTSMLHFSIFAQDGTLMEQGVSMLQAKGFAWIHLEDAVSVLNRRKDL